MTQVLVELEVDLINQFPHQEVFDKDSSPNAIILGTPRLDYKSIKIVFGSYAQEYATINNSMEPRTKGAITLKPLNDQGAYYFM